MALYSGNRGCLPARSRDNSRWMSSLAPMVPPGLSIRTTTAFTALSRPAFWICLMMWASSDSTRGPSARTTATLSRASFGPYRCFSRGPSSSCSGQTRTPHRNKFNRTEAASRSVRKQPHERRRGSGGGEAVLMGSLGREMRRMIGLRARSAARDNPPRPREPHMYRPALLASVILALPAAADDATEALAKELRDYATKELAKVPGKDGKYSTALADYLRQEIGEA